MIDARLVEFAKKQDGVVAVWQLRRAGWSPDAIRCRTVGLPRIHDGVFLAGFGVPTRRQLRRAATLTTPRSCLSHASAAAEWGFRPWEGSFEVVVRPGSGGPQRHGDLLVMRSQSLDGFTTTRDGLRITTAERALIDLAAHLPHRDTGKAFREAIRLKHLTPQSLDAAVRAHPNARGTAALRQLIRRYTVLPFHRCRSDAEAYGLEVLHDAHRETPDVNFRIAGEEADFSWAARRLIIEIDGPGFHLFKDEDARKTASWQAAGWTVRRISSDDVFRRPEHLLAIERREA